MNTLTGFFSQPPHDSSRAFLYVVVVVAVVMLKVVMDRRSNPASKFMVIDYLQSFFTRMI